MARKRMSDLKGRALENFQSMRECHMDLMRITPTIWKEQTKLGITHPRSATLQSVDRELQHYHTQASSGDGSLVEKIENQAILAVVLYYALAEWKRKDRSDKDPNRTGPEAWKFSARNKKGAITRMDTLLNRYVHYATKYNIQALPDTHEDLFAWQIQQYDNLFFDLFKDAYIIPKKSFIRETIAALGAGVAVATGVDARIMDGLETLGGRITNSTAFQNAQAFILRIAEAVKNWFGAAADTRIIRQAIAGLGIAEAFFENLLAKAAAAVGKVIASIPGLSLVGDLAAAAKAFGDAIIAHMKAQDGVRARYAVRTGAATDAYNTVVNFWDEECKENLQAAGTSLVKAAVKGVILAVGGVVGAAIETAATVATAVYTACKKVWDAIMKVVETVKEIIDANAALAGLVKGTANDTKKIFEISPLLATHYFLSLETSHIIMLDTRLMGLHGFKQIVERLKESIDPVIEKAGEYLADSKFMFVKADGKPFPIRAKLGDPSLMEQIKAMILEQVPNPIEDLQEEGAEAFTGFISDRSGITGEMLGIEAEE